MHLTNKPTRSDSTGKLGSSKGTGAGTRVTKILLVSVLGTVLLLAAFVVLFPLEEPEDSSPASARLPTAALPDNARESAIERDQVASPIESNGRAGLPSPTARSDKLTFPKQTEPIEIGELQEELRDLARRLQAEYPEDSGAFHFAAQIYFELNQTEEAEKTWRKSIERPNAAAGPYAGLAELLINSGRESGAIEILEQAVANGIQSAEIDALLAEAYENLGQLELSRETLAVAIQKYPEDGDLWLARGRVLNQLGDFEVAEDSLMRTLELNGESEKVLFLLSTAQLRQGKTEVASETRQRIRSLREKISQVDIGFQENYESALRDIAAEVFVSTAALAENYMRLDEAEKQLLRAIQLVPNNAQAYMSLSSVMRKQGKLTDALEVHQRLVEIQPDNLLNYTNLASIALQNGAIELARNTLLEATELDPEGVVAQALLAKLYLAEQKFSEAERWAGQVLKRNRSVESHLLLASIYEAQGDVDAAQKLVAQARSYAPQHPMWKTAQ